MGGACGVQVSGVVFVCQGDKVGYGGGPPDFYGAYGLHRVFPEFQGVLVVAVVVLGYFSVCQDSVGLVFQFCCGGECQEGDEAFFGGVEFQDLGDVFECY